ncbi:MULTISPECIES: DUF4124 domain-containing protein [Lysobacter]|uniref:DUF4124 domain-containing protein n=1 Tax=Lysobacter firmicutimachus TaxID=1792846 RepID=A0ABU8D2R7_9GAMM|nr:DUF4124 domain-containing protein [Lysobacter antibioticus]
MKTWICYAVLLLSPAASAQMVYKCIGKGGAVSYQSDPCAGTKTAKSWTATPEAPPTNEELWRRHRAQKKADADSRYLSRIAGRSRSGAAAGAAVTTGSFGTSQCENMKRMRDANVTNDTGYDGRRAWADQVYDACK